MAEPSIDVLLVEDNPGDAILVREGLADAPSGHFVVRTTTSLHDALTAIDAARPDVVLLDLTLPDSSGLDTVKQLRSAWPSLPVVVLTGLDDDRIGVEAMKEGAQDYIIKDEATGRRIARAVRFALERSNAVQQVQQWRERYTLWIQQSGDGLWDWDLDTGKVTYSPGWKEALGYAPDQLGDSPNEWFDRVVSRDASDLANTLQGAIDRGESTFTADYRIRTRTGNVRWMRARGMLVLDSHGRAVRVAGSQTDVTHELPNPCIACGHLNDGTTAECVECGSPLDVREHSPGDVHGGGAELAPGTVLSGRYRIERLLAVGGAGAVYVGFDDRSGRRVAIKVLHGWLFETADSRARFVAEGEAQTTIEHPAVVRVLDVVATDTRDFIVMEYVPGTTVREFLVSADAPATAEEVVELFRPVIDGLAVAHAAGIVHRDIKPDNLLVVRTDSGFALKVIDFGVAKIAGVSRQTRTGAILGTLAYMAPEQFVDARSVDARADIYALGCTLFELLTRRPPFDYDSDFRMMTAHLTEQPPHPRAYNPLVSAPVGDAILRALAKDPEDRYPTCEAFGVALLQALRAG